MKIEDRLRDVLARRVASIEPSDDAWTSVANRLTSRSAAPRTSPGARVAAGAVALLLGAGAVFIAARAFTPSGRGPMRIAIGDGATAEAWTVHTMGEEGNSISIETPLEWTFLNDPLRIEMWPSILFAVGNYDLPVGGGCAPTDALEVLPRDGVLLWVSESRGLGLHPEDFPPRPTHFELDPKSLANYECSGTWQTYLIWFRDAGRFFQAQVAFGADTTESLRADLVRALDSIIVEPVFETPDCPSVEGGNASVVDPVSGTPGLTSTVSGTLPPPYQESGLRVSQWKIEVWWNLAAAPGWASFSLEPPPAAQPSPVVLLGEQATGATCSYDVAFTVPDVPPGTYTIVVIRYGGGGATSFPQTTFDVTA